MMQNSSIKKIYNTQSYIYDLIFKRFFYPRHRHVINSIDIRPNHKVLDVGVGTGLTLPLYPEFCEVTGIDLSAEMLKKAQDKVDKFDMTHITLKEMDASNLEFPDDTFDFVIATFVISVVPDPVKVIAEMKRVCKKDGLLIIMNHFKSKNKLMGRIEEALNPFTCKIGWKANLCLDELAKNANLEIHRKESLKKIDLWKIIYAVNNK